MGQEELSLLSALVYLLSILSNAYRQTDFVLQEELCISLNDQTGFAVKRKTRVLRVYMVMQNHIMLLLLKSAPFPCVPSVLD